MSGFWVGVECGFRCGACGHFSPLNYLDVDGDAQCLRCGIEQRFDRGQWWEGLRLAHAVGDLAGPAPEGRFPKPGPAVADSNPYREIGVDKTFAEHRQQRVIIDGAGIHQHSLSVRAMPGHPLCSSCKQPLEVTACVRGELAVVCPGCGDARTYVRPERIPKSLRALGGVLAMDHEKGGRRADVQEGAGGAVAIRCPNCSAPLDYDGKSTVVRCRFCRVVARIPANTLRSLGAEHPEQLRWWLFFTGVSAERRKLQRKATKEQKKQAQAQQRAYATQPGQAAAEPVAQRSSSSRVVVGLIISAPVALVVAGVIFAASYQSWTTSRSSTPAAVPATATARTYPTVQLDWKGTVNRTRGVKRLRRGAPCVVRAETQGSRIHRVTVNCGRRLIYDSRTQASGVIRMSSGLAEAPSKSTPGAYTYGMIYTNTGQFSGRPQVSINTLIGQGVVFSTVPPILRVELHLDTNSAPHAGQPVFNTPSRAPNVKWKAIVTSIEGKSPVKIGARCSLEVFFTNKQIHHTWCAARLHCGRRWLFGNKKQAAHEECTIDSSGVPLTIDGSAPGSGARTPRFNYDATRATAGVRSMARGYSVKLALSR